MPDFLSQILSPAEIESLEREVIEEARAGSQEAAWHNSQPLAEGTAPPTRRCLVFAANRPYTLPA